MKFLPNHPEPHLRPSFAAGGTNVRRLLLAPMGALGLLACVGMLAFFVLFETRIPRFAMVALPGAALSIYAIVHGIAWNLRMRRLRSVFERTARALHARVMVPGEWARWYWRSAWPIAGPTDDALSAALDFGGAQVFVDLRAFPDLHRLAPALVVLASGRLAPDATQRLASAELGALYQRLAALGFVVEVHPSGLVLRANRETVARITRTSDLSVLHEVAAHAARLTAFAS